MSQDFVSSKISSQTILDFRAGYLESGVNRIVEQVVEQKMDYIQSKVEEILYDYVGMEKPIKREKQDALEVETDLLPTDLEQVSPDSDKKSSASGLEVIKDEEIEEEIVEDEDFESPAFEPIEPMVVEKNENENSHQSNLSSISGLTSQDSAENKSEPSPPGVSSPKQESQLSQISSLQEMSQSETCDDLKKEDESKEVKEEIESAAETQEVMDTTDAAPPAEPEQAEKSNFDLKKDCIEFTGTERKPLTLDDSTNSAEAEKALQPEDVPSNTMEIDNLYENDTTDSSEMRMEIDLKDDTTQETADSSKVEESSQDSGVSKEKPKSVEAKKESSHHRSSHKSSDRDHSRDKHKSSHKSSHHHRSSSSRSHHDDKSKSRSDVKSSSSKKSSSDRHRSSSGRSHDKDKDRKSSKDDGKSRRDHKSDDHHQEKSSSRRRRSTDHDSNDGKSSQDKPKSSGEIPSQASANKDSEPQAVETKSTTESSEKNQDSIDSKAVVVDAMLSENCEISIDSKSSSRKSSILVKHDYFKSPAKPSLKAADITDGFCGFEVEKLPDNPWFDYMRRELSKPQKKKVIRRGSNNNYLDQKKSLNLPRQLKTKSKSKSPPIESSSTELNGEIAAEPKVQLTIAQQQRYTDDDLYKPRMDFGGRRRGQVIEETAEVPVTPEEVSTT